MASHDEVRAALVAKELENALVKALERARHRDPALDVDGNTELENASEREDEEPSADQNISSGVTVQNEQKVFFSLGKNGVNEYVRTADGCFVMAARSFGSLTRITRGQRQKKTLLATRQRRKKPALTPARPNKSQAGCSRPGICRRN